MRIRVGWVGGVRWLAPAGLVALGLGLGLGLGLAGGPKPVEARPVRTAVESYFSPQGGAELAIQRSIDQANAEVRYASLGYTGGHPPIKFHHKYAVIDRQKGITGGYNWTRQADTHTRENMVILYGKRVAKSVRQNCEQEWTTLKP